MKWDVNKKNNTRIRSISWKLCKKGPEEQCEGEAKKEKLFGTLNRNILSMNKAIKWLGSISGKDLPLMKTETNMFKMKILWTRWMMTICSVMAKMTNMAKIKMKNQSVQKSKIWIIAYKKKPRIKEKAAKNKKTVKFKF